MEKHEITAIAAVDRNLAIGRCGKLLCHIPGDLDHFKRETDGGILIMGRKTLESLPGGRPLPGRTTIVLSSCIPQGEFFSQGDAKAFAVRSREEALLLLEELEKDKKAQEESLAEADRVPADSGKASAAKVFIAGGEEIYKLFLEDCSQLTLTLIDEEFEDADVFFPDFIESGEFALDSESEPFEENGYRYTIRRYVRCKGADDL